MVPRGDANIAANAHNVSNVTVDIDGDKRPHALPRDVWTWTRATLDAGPLRPADYVVSVSYVDELSRYPEGWRIDRRVLEPHGTARATERARPRPAAPDPGRHPALSRRAAGTTATVRLSGRPSLPAAGS